RLFEGDLVPEYPSLGAATALTVGLARALQPQKPIAQGFPRVRRRVRADLAPRGVTPGRLLGLRVVVRAGAVATRVDHEVFAPDERAQLAAIVEVLLRAHVVR